MRRDHVLDRHVAVLADVEEPRQQRRHLDPGEHGDALLRVDQRDREVERQPGDEGERVRRVDHQRRQHRVDALLEHLGQAGPLVPGQLLPAQDLDALGSQSGLDLVREDSRVPARQQAGLGQGVLQQLLGGPADGVLDREARRHSPHQAGDPDLEELVQVGGEDGQEADALEQGDLLVLGQFKDALVELDPAVLPVEVPVGGEIVTHDPHCPRACSLRKRVRAGSTLRMILKQATRVRRITFGNCGYTM